MRQRSLLKIFIFNVLTLGLYEFYWLSRTRRDMIALSGYRIPAMAKYVLLRFMTAALVVLALWNLHVALKPRPVVEKPAAACFGRYDTDPACRRALDGYYAGDNQVSSLVIFFACLLGLAVLYWFSLKWLVPYLEAVQRVTGGTDAANFPMFLLFMYAPGIGMLIVQNRFNRLPER